jgi:mitochondrial enoyl-[acyl-carrier protein] reductase / trans-2-enoyl-CoA reductase
VAQVLSVGANVTHFAVGDHVVPLTTGLGTWRSHAVFKASDVMAVPKSVGIVDAAALTVNPCTSYRMLKDFVDLQPGDTVIQNGANSSCGQYAIQLCHAWQVNCIGVVRNRPDIDELKKVLKEMGAAEVLTEEELQTTAIFETGQYKVPKLALNCVGGQSATELWRRLDNHGTLVTYGEKSGQPVTAPVAAFIYKDIRFCGFWMTRWRKTQAADSPLRKAMFDDLIGLIESGQVKPPVHELVPVENYKDALARAANSRGFLGTKCILKF